MSHPNISILIIIIIIIFQKSQAHDSYVTIRKEQKCNLITELLQHEQCEFFNSTIECSENVHLFDYMNFIFCTTNFEYLQYVGILTLCVWCCYMFTILGTTADKFFCPALTVLAKVMKMSENLAGVTLLAFGNGSPDIFTSVANSSGDTELMYSELFGAASFIIAIIGGSIILIKPFMICKSNFVRDCLFFMIALLWITISIHDSAITISEAIGIIFIYILYLIVVIVDHLLLQRKTNETKAIIQKRSIESANIEDSNTEKKLKRRLSQLKKVTSIEIKSSKSNISLTDNDILENRHSSFMLMSKNDQIFKQFLNAINPIDGDDWNEAGKFGKIMCCLKVPVVFVLLLIIPIVDFTIEMHGWSKLLNILHIFTLPQFALFACEIINYKLYLPLWLIVLIISTIFSIIVFRTSTTSYPPTYHLIYAIGSFIGSILIIYIFATEIVSVLETLGFLSKLSNSMLGLSVLAWGNSIGDLISNIALARKGYQRMGFAACFGGPMFNSLMGIGLTFLIKCYNAKDGIAFGREGQLGPNCSIFLFFILLFTLVACSLINFQARRCIGILMIIMYLIFLLFCFLGEFEIIHPYGTDHQDEGDFV